MPLSRTAPISLYLTLVWINSNEDIFFQLITILYRSHSAQVLWVWAGFLGLLPAPLSTGYKAAQHANMLWHFACCTHLDAISPPQLGHTSILLMSPSWRFVIPSHFSSIWKISKGSFKLTPDGFWAIVSWVTLKGGKAFHSIDCVRGFQNECHLS